MSVGGGGGASVFVKKNSSSGIVLKGKNPIVAQCQNTDLDTYLGSLWREETPILL